MYKRLPSAEAEIVLEKGVNLTEVLPALLSSDEKLCFVSAGGDGSVHYLVNHLLTTPRNSTQQVTLGAIGLGSSNDFLKPFGEKIRNIPVRINRSGGSFLHDVGVATYRDEAGCLQKKYFIVNASLGVTAQANSNFNNPGTTLKFLKKHFSSGAILYTAVSTILSHKNTPFHLKYNDTELMVSISNINILKLPYVSGSFFYNQDISRDDGQLGLNVCMNMTKRELLYVLGKLQKGKFPAFEKTISVFTNNVSLTADESFVFECDGETEKATSLHVTILPNALSVLKS